MVFLAFSIFFFFNDTATTEIYTLSLHDALPISIGHQGVMAVNGRGVGVLGTGIDVCYPKENKKLYEKVLERGAILSEFPFGTHPAPENFPVRNRIVAGMPLGVVVVEGAQYSGSLITARLAMEFG